ncbi:M42 family metallopeptidase [Brochothrix thermosphacta]|uniref:M42 family metallopeptidase n=1 Tax=Brochothrix thermosphacta TaxID=2756 RepID=UPI000D7A5F78|nr:M42 family metallopeptidase [Brochothrix thermosphacta]SPN74563.1 putative aminopeptidase [Brochothrix thermosphacta]
MKITTESTMNTILELTNIASPTGHTEKIMEHITHRLEAVGLEVRNTNKGNRIVTIAGEDNTQHRLLTAHVDTLGAMVKEVKSNGRLALTLVGGFRFNAIEGEYCTIETADGRIYTGTILMHQTTVHVYQDSGSAERNAVNMEVRLDEKVVSADETRSLGIEVGDFISFDPRSVRAGDFIKSRHLDDKVSVAVLLEALMLLAKEKITLPYTTHFLISNNEEIGYGGNSSIPEEVVEYIAVDMGAIGDGQTSDEYHVSICAKDSSGPYHYGLRQHLVGLAQASEIAYCVDIYPFYGSDASAAMKAGADVKHALIGAGIEASHAYERTHKEAVVATEELVCAYLFSPLAKN